MDPFVVFIITFCLFGSMSLGTAVTVGLLGRKNWEGYSNNMKGSVIIVFGLLIMLTSVSFGAAGALAYIWRYMI